MCPRLRRVLFCFVAPVGQHNQNLTGKPSNVPAGLYAHLAPLGQCASLRQHGAGGALKYIVRFAIFPPLNAVLPLSIRLRQHGKGIARRSPYPLGRLKLFQGGFCAACVSFSAGLPLVLCFVRSSLFWWSFFSFFVSLFRGWCFCFSCWGGSSACCFCSLGGCFFCGFFWFSFRCSCSCCFCCSFCCCSCFCGCFCWLRCWLRFCRSFGVSRFRCVSGFFLWSWSWCFRCALGCFSSFLGGWFFSCSCFGSCCCLSCWSCSVFLFFSLLLWSWLGVVGWGCFRCWRWCSCGVVFARWGRSSLFFWFRWSWWWFLCFSPRSAALLAFFFFTHKKTPLSRGSVFSNAFYHSCSMLV